MSNFLRLSKHGNLYLEDQLVTTHDVPDINEYLMQLLGFYTSIDGDVRVDEVVHSVFGMKKFIRGFFSEDYEVIRAFANTSTLDRKYKAIKLFKSFKVESDDFLSEEEFLYVLPEVAFIEAEPGETGYDKLGELPVIIDNDIHLIHNGVDLKLKSKFTLLDILTCVFDEMSACLKEGKIITI